MNVLSLMFKYPSTEVYEDWPQRFASWWDSLPTE